MKKILMSGDCKMGEVGSPTKLIDYGGWELYVGDLVALSSYDDNNPESYRDFFGIEYICDNTYCDDGLDKRIYVMGIANEHKQYEDEFQESIVIQNHKKWRIKKVKGFEELVDGEKWGCVHVVFEED